MRDDIDIRAIGDILKEADRGFAGPAKAQPVMGRHEQNGVGADRFCRKRLRDGFIAALGADARDHLDLVPDFVGDDLGDARPFVIAQGHDFAGMPRCRPGR